MTTAVAQPRRALVVLGAGHRLVIIALVATALRLLFAGSIHLTEDEAYYRLWAQHLQFGYYDHPPMIAWWIRLGESLAGDTPLGVRLLPSLGTGIATWLIGDLTLRLGASEAAAARAAIWYNATLTIALGGFLATPDAPASLFWTLTVWCLARRWDGGRGSWWLAAGISAGLCALSKYSGLFLAPGVLLWLGLAPQMRAELRRPGPWLAALVAGLVFAVNVAWNAEHHWMTFAKQFGRVAGHGLHLGDLPAFLFTQFVLLNPLIAIFAVAGVGLGWRTRRLHGGPHLVLPIATGLPFAAYLILHSLHDRVQGHWPVPLFAALAVCAAVAADQTRRRWLRGAAPALGFAVAALTLAHAAMPRSGYLTVFDPTLALRGWPAFAGQVEQLRRREGAAWVGTESYGLAAQLDLERQLRAPVLQVLERARYWPDAPERPDLTRPGLVVDLARRVNRSTLLRCFADVRAAGDLDRGANKGPNAHYVAFRVALPRVDVWNVGCPKPPLKAAP
jgi:4-amino-4-deoxy-L-arabinose transferase-like glycosyltransferase